MSETPWDKLRTAKPPLSPGEWRTSGGTTVEWAQADCVNIHLSLASIGPLLLHYRSAREIGEFLIELSGQVEKSS